MKAYEIFPLWFEIMSEDYDAMAKSADANMKVAKQQKKNAQILKTKDTLNTQQKQLSDIVKSGSPYNH